MRRILRCLAVGVAIVPLACGDGESGAGNGGNGGNAGNAGNGGNGGNAGNGGSSGGGAGGAAATGALPEGPTGVASNYPGDAGIDGDPSVIFTDDFEAASVPADLRDKWDVVFDESRLRIAVEPQNVNAGGKAVEMPFPVTSDAVGNGLMKHLVEEQDVVFLRFYQKFEAGFDVTGAGSFHNTGSISAHYHVDGQSTPGIPANGTNKYLVSYESTVYSDGPPPGHLIAYVYHPEQRDDYGDIFYPTGLVSPNTSLPFDFGPNFVAMPNIAPALDTWQCYELMVKANTPGQRDGRIGMWLDGKLIADFQNLRFRDVASLTIDYLTIGGYISPNEVRENKLWFDDVVAATQYIGPRS